MSPQSHIHIKTPIESHTAGHIGQHSLTPQFWEPSRSLTLNAAIKHTALIKAICYGCFLIAGLILAALLYFMIVEGQESSLVETPIAESVRMTNPRYTGLDGNGNPYNLTAEYAVRAIDNPDAVRLINPVLKFSGVQGRDGSAVFANEGIYAHKTQILDLHDEVNVDINGETQCQTSHARILTLEQRVEGEQPIRCDGSFGHADGQQFEIIDNYSRFIFSGQVKATLLPAPQNRLERSKAFENLTPNKDISE